VPYSNVQPGQLDKLLFVSVIVFTRESDGTIQILVCRRLNSKDEWEIMYPGGYLSSGSSWGAHAIHLVRLRLGINIMCYPLNVLEYKINRSHTFDGYHRQIDFCVEIPKSAIPRIYVMNDAEFDQRIDTSFGPPPKYINWVPATILSAMQGNAYKKFRQIINSLHQRLYQEQLRQEQIQQKQFLQQALSSFNLQLAQSN